MCLGSFQIKYWIPSLVLSSDGCPISVSVNRIRIRPSSVEGSCFEWVRLMEGHHMVRSTFMQDLVSGRRYMFTGICRFVQADRLFGSGCEVESVLEQF